VRAKAKSLICLAVLLAAAPLVQPAASADGSLVMMAGYQQRIYSPGEALNFTLYVFYDGEPLSPQDPPAVSVIQDIDVAIYAVPVVLSGQGRYSGRYTVLAADIEDDGTIRLRADAAYRGTSGLGLETATAWIDVTVDTGRVQNDSLRVVARLVESSDSPVRPGTDLAFECCVTADGGPADPDGLSFWMRHSVEWPGSSDRILPQRQGPGSYLVHYEIPRQNQSDRFFLYAGWTNGKADQYTGAQVGLDLYQVVYHELARTGTRVDYELLISDRDGAGVNGSSVRLDISPGYDSAGTAGAPSGNVSVDLGLADHNGRVRSLLDLGGYGQNARISGWANTSRFSQRFCGSVVIFGGQKEQLIVPGSGFRVVRTGMEGEPAPGDTIRLDYRAFYDSRLLRDVLVDCYIEMTKEEQTGSASLSVVGQRVTTDDEGGFVLNLSFPAGVSSIASMTFVGPQEAGGYRPRGSDAVRAVWAATPNDGAGWVNASFSRAEPGNPVAVSVHGAGLAAASANWQFDFGESGSEQRQWSAWTSMEWPLVPRANGSLPLKGKIVLPASLRTGLNITVSLQLVNSSGETSSTGFPVRVVSPKAASSGDELCCLAGAAALNIGLLAFVLIQYRSAKKAPPRKQFEEQEVDERIGDILNPPGGPPTGPAALPFKAELVQSVDCAVCGRKIAKGNMAWGCACGRKFHEHCLPKDSKCAHCGREWTIR
jgi:hypothetical protein